MKSKIIALLHIICLTVYSCAFFEESGPPVDAATFLWEENQISLIYNGQLIFTGNINHSRDQVQVHSLIDKKGKTLSQVVSLTSLDNEPVLIEGIVYGSAESFPSEADRPVYKRDLVRHSF